MEASQKRPLVTRRGTYRVERLLRRDPSGERWLAREEGTGRLVVVRSFRARDPEVLREPFASAVRPVADLRVGGLARLLDFGSSGPLWFVIHEAIRGESLLTLRSRLVSRGQRLPYTVAARMIASLAATVEEVHRAGVVIGSLAPANVALTPEGALRLLDVGLAPVLHRMFGETAFLLQGNLRYASPEQVRSEPLAPAADVFALGAILAELASGRVMFGAPHPTLVLELLKSGQVPAPEDLDPELPSTLADAIREATVADPTRRLPSARALADRLTELLAEATLIHGQGDSARGGDDLSELLASLAPSGPSEHTSEDFQATLVPEEGTLVLTAAVAFDPTTLRPAAGGDDPHDLEPTTLRPSGDEPAPGRASAGTPELEEWSRDGETESGSVATPLIARLAPTETQARPVSAPIPQRTMTAAPRPGELARPVLEPISSESRSSMPPPFIAGAATIPELPRRRGLIIGLGLVTGIAVAGAIGAVWVSVAPSATVEELVRVNASELPAVRLGALLGPRPDLVWLEGVRRRTPPPEPRPADPPRAAARPAKGKPRAEPPASAPSAPPPAPKPVVVEAPTVVAPVGRGRLRVVVREAGQSVPLEVFVDGHLVGQAPLLHEVASGRHVVEVRAPGGRRSRSVDVPADADAKITIDIDR